MATKILFILFYLLIFPQSKDPDKILENVKEEFGKVEDYVVDVSIKVDIPFLKMPERKARIFYKKPDKYYIDSEGFALLPKEGMNFSLLTLLNSEHSALYEGEENINGINAALIKIIPLDENRDVLRSTLWIDASRNIILKAESYLKQAGIITIEFDYLKTSEGFYLPSQMTFIINAPRMFFSSRLNKGPFKDNSEKEDSVKTEEGKVYITYSNYKVNKGLKDDIFEKKD